MSSSSVSAYESAKASGNTAGMTAAREAEARANNANAAATQGSYNSSGVWNPSNSSSGSTVSSSPVTDMTKWYNETKAAQGYNPTADQVSSAMDSYRNYVAGKTNPNSGTVWNQYGEVIGNTGTGTGGYTDFSWQGANATVDPNRIWNADARNNSGYQRVLTGTPLTGTYLDYNTNTWGQAPLDYRTGKANSPGFINYAQLGTMANNWLNDNPGSLWDVEGLTDLWQNKYQDLSAIPNMMNQYAHEFANGIVPSNFQYDPNSLYGDARTGAAAQAAPLYPGATATTAGAVTPNAVNQQAGTYLENPNWVGNIFPGAQWNESSKTISIPGGAVLREGIDFVIGQDNRAYVLPNVGANITPNLNYATKANSSGVMPDTGNQWHNFWRDIQNQYANAMPAFSPPAREEFRFTTPLPSISSSGDDIHIPTLAAKQQWENEQNALQDQYAKQYGVNYQRAQDIYNTQLDWLKTGMAEQQRQEDIAREAARYQAETALKQDQDRYSRAWNMWNAGAGTDEIYRILGIPAGTKPFDQVMNEWKMDLANKEYALSAAKAASGGGSGGSSSGYYLDTQVERANVSTGQLLSLSIKQYELNKAGGGNVAQHPLYYTLNSLFNDPTWRAAATSSGSNIKQVADALITKYSGKSPRDYFSSGKAADSSVAAAYKQLLSLSERDSWDY